MTTYARTAAGFSNKTGTYSFVAGQPVYTFGDGHESFSHCIILGFTDDGTYAKVARPYAYASNVGTTGPSVLLGAEVYECRTDSLKALPSTYSARVVTP